MNHPVSPDTIRMLLVEDDRVDQMAFQRAAREQGWGYDFVIADSVEAARERLAGPRFDVVVTDFRLGDGVAFEFFPQVAPACLVVTTASGDEEVAVAAMKAGADDYLIKDPDRNYLKVLPLTVASALERRRIRAELAQTMASLRQRSADLEAANRELVLFSYSVAHDLRSPLRAVTGFAELLAEEHTARLDDEGRTLVNRIVEGGKQMHRLIEGMLALYQTERTTPVLREVDLSELARSAAAEMTAHLPAGSVELAVAPGITAVADPELIKNVLDNLIGNAIKYSGRNPGARVEFGTVPHGTGRAYFVRDNGAGFDASQSARLFKPFQRLHTTQEFPGIGIGLASVEKIVRFHGGRVWAESSVGAGATFYFTLGAT